MNILEFIFQDFIHFIGVLVLWTAFCVGVVLMVQAARK